MIAVAEGAGQDLLGAEATERDASGNLKLQDIGPFLCEKIKSYFKSEDISVVIRYFDPSYQIEAAQQTLRMHCSAICSRVTRFMQPWQVRLVLSSVFYTSASSMYRSSCSLRTRNDSTPPAAGGARFSLLQDSRHNSIEQSSRKQRLWITKPFNNQRPHNLTPEYNSPLSARFLRTNAPESPGCERRSH